MNVERGRKVLRLVKYLIEDYFPELKVEQSPDMVLVRVKDGDSGRGFTGNN